MPLVPHRGVSEGRTGRQTGRFAKFGWRLAIGGCLVAGGYALLVLIPPVLAADFHPTIKATLVGLLGVMPLITKVLAVAIVGKPAVNYIKQRAIKFFQT